LTQVLEPIFERSFLPDSYARRQAAEFLAGLRPRLHPTTDVGFPVLQGIPFLGYRTLATHRLLTQANV
jgi:hypothetical protein